MLCAAAVMADDGSDIVTLFVSSGQRVYVLLVSGSRIMNGQSSTAAENEVCYGAALSIG